MSVWALVPAKDFARGKSRLRPALSDGARVTLARRLFDHVLDRLCASGAVDGVLVATDAPEVAAAARRHGAAVHFDPPASPSLATVVDGGLEELGRRGATTAAVLMADLPALTMDDVMSLVRAAATAPVVLVRADDGHHTNALVLSPPRCLRTAFGQADSFARHLAAARAAGLEVRVLDSPRIAFDLDDPGDHARLLVHGGGAHRL